MEKGALVVVLGWRICLLRTEVRASHTGSIEDHIEFMEACADDIDAATPRVAEQGRRRLQDISTELRRLGSLFKNERNEASMDGRRWIDEHALPGLERLYRLAKEAGEVGHA